MQPGRAVMQRLLPRLAIILVMTPAQPANATSITWRVENPFRLFLDPATTAQHRVTLDRLAPDERAMPILAVERRLATASPRGWAERAIDQVCWNEKQQGYECTEAPTYSHPQVHRIIATLDPRLAGSCVWTITSSAASTARRDERLAGPCEHGIAVDVPFPNGIDISVSSDAGVTATTRVQVRDLFIVSIGDSFASGDGNPDVPIRFDDRRSFGYRAPGNAPVAGYPARVGGWAKPQDPAFAQNGPRWLSTACHRSLYGHHARAALQLALEDPHRAVTFASFGCWGSDIVNGVFLPMKPTEVVPQLPRVSQLSAVAKLQCRPGMVLRKDWPRAFEMSGRLPELVGLTGLYCPPEQARRIDLMLVAIGGNDVGFAQLVANAVLSDATPLRQLTGWLGQLSSPAKARAALALLPERYKALNRAARSILHIPWSQSDRIVLTGYPPLALDDDTRDACAGGRDGMTVNPGFSLDQARTRDSERIGAELFEVMRREATRHGWTFVDAHRAVFMRHGLCAGRPDRIANPADDLRLPRYRDGRWHPFPPSQWEPYTPRLRWVRTPNDGFLTVNFHVPSVADTAINLMLASSYSGAFHPTAEGHAAMADAVVVRARGVLDKYAAVRFGPGRQVKK